uniref:Uncharacterized protein n=1 Tax=Arundo donax TaxID=35708 RepID=A0A0A9EPF6_ARUDO
MIRNRNARNLIIRIISIRVPCRYIVLLHYSL